MSAYQTVVVGTDGSDSSLCAVDRAGAIAADHGAKLILATAHLHPHEAPGGLEPPGEPPAVPYGFKESDSYNTVGDAHIEYGGRRAYWVPWRQGRLTRSLTAPTRRCRKSPPLSPMARHVRERGIAQAGLRQRRHSRSIESRQWECGFAHYSLLPEGSA
jgi:nucleotide-binding universal stress UspA family protein